MLIVLRDGLSQYENGKLVTYQPGAVVDFAPHIAQSMIDRGRATLRISPAKTPPERSNTTTPPNPPTPPKRGAGRPKKG